MAELEPISRKAPLRGNTVTMLQIHDKPTFPLGGCTGFGGHRRPQHTGDAGGVDQLLHRNVQRFRGGLVFKAHKCVSLNCRLDSNKEEEKVEVLRLCNLSAQGLHCP